jgi:hypothetical protein
LPPLTPPPLPAPERTPAPRRTTRSRHRAAPECVVEVNGDGGAPSGQPSPELQAADVLSASTPPAGIVGADRINRLILGPLLVGVGFRTGRSEARAGRRSRPLSTVRRSASIYVAGSRSTARTSSSGTPRSWQTSGGSGSPRRTTRSPRSEACSRQCTSTCGPR